MVRATARRDHQRSRRLTLKFSFSRAQGAITLRVSSALVDAEDASRTTPRTRAYAQSIPRQRVHV